MADAAAYLDEVEVVVEALTDLGLGPILVGGMALVMIGSRRVTRDFDFVIPRPGERLQGLVDVFYDRGLELVSRLNDAGDVTATINNRRVAAGRLRLDAPASAYFFNPETGLRIDVLLDFRSRRRRSRAAPGERRSALASFGWRQKPICCASRKSRPRAAPPQQTPWTSPFSSNVAIHGTTLRRIAGVSSTTHENAT